MDACPSPEELDQFARDALNPGQAERIQKHLLGCETCTATVELASSRTLPRSGGGAGEALRPTDPGMGVTGKIGRYHILERLGRGGMGEVYAAYDPQLDRRIALKILRADVLRWYGAEDGRARLLLEARAMARLSHPNIVSVHDAGISGDEVFLAMDLVEGETLAEWLRLERPWREVLRLFIEAGRGLAGAHQAGIVHRDFKPGNVLVSLQGRVLVADFGLAEAPSGEAPRLEAAGPGSGPGKQRTGEPGGTIGFMAPEVIQGQGADARSDQFSFAVALFEALHDRKLFRSRTVAGIAEELAKGLDLTPSPKANLPGHVQRALARALSVDPAQRFPSMDALLAELSRDPAARRRRLLAVTAVGALAAGAIGAAAWTASKQRGVCSGGPERFAGAWSREAAARVEQAFTASGSADAAPALKAVQRLMERYGADWAAAYREACEATRIRGEQSEGLLDLRMACLDRRRSQARALAAVLQKADQEVVRNGIRAVSELPPVAECGDLAGLRSSAQPPPAADSRPVVEAIRADLDEALALLNAGKAKDGVVVADRALEKLPRARYRPVDAEAYWISARLRGLVLDSRTAEAHALAAEKAALETHQLTLAVGAMASIIRYASQDPARAAEGERWASVGEGLLAHAGAPPEAAAKLYHAMAGLASHRDRHAEALALADQAIQAMEGAGIRNTLYAECLARRAGELWGLGRLVEAAQAYETALAVQRELVASDFHPFMARYYGDLADIYLTLGEDERARALSRKVVDVMDAFYGKDHLLGAMARGHLALALARLGRSEEGLAVAREIEASPAFKGRVHNAVYGVHLELGEAYSALHRFPDAERHFRTSLEGPDEEGGSPERAQAMVGLAWTYFARGRAKEALGLLEPAVKILDQKVTAAVHQGEARLALAQALFATRGDARRAWSLLDEAERAFEAAGPRGARAREAIASVRRAHAPRPPDDR